MIKISCVILFCLVLILPISSEFVSTVYTGVLSTEAVVPSQSDTNGNGVAVCIYSRNASPKTIDCEVQFSLQSQFGPYYSGIYRGNPSQNGPLLYEFEGEIISNFRQRFFVEDLILDDGSTYTVEEQEHDFLNGKWHILITSPNLEYAALRANLLQEHFMYARLENSNVKPSIYNSDSIDSHGLIIGSYSYFDPFKTAEFVLSHDVEGAIRAGLYEGEIDEIGPADFVFESPGEITQTVSYSLDMESRLFNDEQYFQIDSITYTNGELRGQMNTIDQMPPVSFTARLDGANVIPKVTTLARGCGLFSLNCHTLELEYLVHHTTSDSTIAWINLGDKYSNGVKMFPLPRSEGPIYGSRILTADEVLSLYQDRLYVTIESLVYPNGEIRGQISDTYNYYAYLTGTQLLPPITSSGIGCGTFKLDELTNDGRVFNYDITFTLPEFEKVTVDLMHGDIGLSGEKLYNIGETFNIVSGTNIQLSSNEANFVGTEKTYIQVGEIKLDGTGGLLRGQILQLNNPCPFITTLPDNNPHTPTSSWQNYEIPTYFEWNNASSKCYSLSIFNIIITFFIILYSFI